MTKVQLLTYGIVLVMKLLARMRQLNEMGDSDEEIEAFLGEIDRDIQMFSEALKGNRQKLDEWLVLERL